MLQVFKQSEAALCADPQPYCAEDNQVCFDTNRMPHGTKRVVSLDIHQLPKSGISRHI